jgi:UDP-glucose 4-epimerase
MILTVTGGAGFIGSNLVLRLLQAGHAVRVFDNMRSGSGLFLETARKYDDYSFVKGDLLSDPALLEETLAGCDMVFHLAANADVRFGIDHPTRDLHQNTIATANVLEAMRKTGVKRIAFSSTSAIYGETKIYPTPEDAPFPIMTSFYAASKLAGEAFIQAYCESYGFQAWIFRFVSILGENYHHGHIYDFYKKLLANPRRLEILGNGEQRKSYLYVQDCIDAILIAMDKADRQVNIFNLGTNEHSSVNDSIRCICERLNLQPEMVYQGGSRGWVGDNPLIFLNCDRIRALGWRPRLSIREGIIRTLEYLMNNPWVLDL